MILAVFLTACGVEQVGPDTGNKQTATARARHGDERSGRSNRKTGDGRAQQFYRAGIDVNAVL